jgi:hypothetical protein
MSMIDYFIHARDVLIGPWSGALVTGGSKPRVDAPAGQDADEASG